MAVPPRRTDNGIVFRAADAIFASDDSLRIVHWNDRAEALFGFTSEDVIGTPCHDLVGCPSLTRRLFCAQAKDARRNQTGDLVPTFGTLIETKTGEPICVDVTMIVTVPHRGPPLRLHVLRDVRRQREIEELVRQVVTGATRLSLDSDARGGSGADGKTNGEARSPCSWGVTAREREVIQLLAQGVTTDGIAEKLHISRRTARNHIQNLLAKLGVHSRLEAVAYASNKGLV